MKVTISGITYDTDTARKLAHKATTSSDEQLFQMNEGDFFLLILHLHVDGVKLGPGESWLELNKPAEGKSRVTVTAKVAPLTSRKALEWCIRTQVPLTLRGYLLDCI